MRLLLDTHVLLWWLSGDPRLSDEVVAELDDPANTVLISAASVWEIEIKRAKKSLKTPDDLMDVLAEQQIEMLDIDANHATEAARLPTHHHDPFDRMLIAQASLEDAVLVTADSIASAYGVAVRSAS